MCEFWGHLEADSHTAVASPVDTKKQESKSGYDITHLNLYTTYIFVIMLLCSTQINNVYYYWLISDLWELNVGKHIITGIYIALTIYATLYILCIHISSHQSLSSMNLQDISHACIHTRTHIRANLDKSWLTYQLVFGMWKETGVRGENPRIPRGNLRKHRANKNST